MSACPTKQHINLSNPERLMSGFSGGLLFAYGVTHLRGLLTVGSLVLGCGLIQRALTGHCSLYESMANSKSRAAAKEAIETASEDSFPASDPPTSSGSVVSRSLG